ncbi:ankyrin repeat domain-containing protein [Candidatus Jidaibacter acanthamoebae]|nr:ankyrin repeat domain-containing protein [Candidatus Jidaibacter acanthamoeba]
MKQNIEYTSQNNFNAADTQQDLITAIKDANEEAAKQLLEQDGSTYSEYIKSKALRLTVQFNMAEIANILIIKGADINATDSSGNTPLIFAAESGDISSMQLLLSKGAYVNAQNRKGNTALMLAINAEVVELLMKNGADINIENNTNRTALNIAIENEKTAIIELLIKKESKVNMIAPILHQNKNFSYSIHQGDNKGWVKMIGRENEIKLRNLQF